MQDDDDDDDDGRFHSVGCTLAQSNYLPIHLFFKKSESVLGVMASISLFTT